MAAQDLGDLQAEILEVKHAIRSDTPCTVHGCEDAGYTAQQLKSARSLPHANRGHETHSSITTTDASRRVYMQAPGAKTEAPKQPKKQDETEAPPGWNRSRQGPEKGPNPDGSGRGKIPGFGGRRILCTFQ